MADSLWTPEQLAAFLGYSETTVTRMVSSAPDRLPPRVAGLGRPRWLPSVVLAWCAAQSRAAPKGGRPRKVG
jgi:predicted DNA-binding transcriptional regulator AlpA